MRVVLAHAEPATRARFSSVLRRVGHEVVETGDAEAALERCRAEAPDVALVDVALCRGDEARIVAAMKADAEAYRAAVVLLERADLDLDGAVSALRRGVQDFLVEPVMDAELVARVEA